MFTTYILFYFYFIINVYGQQQCLTPDDIPGVCISVKDCSYIVDIIQKERPITETTKSKLKKYYCGVQNQLPKVCCPPKKNNSPKEISHKNINLFDQINCGPVNNDRIIPGIEAFLFDYPWNVLIAYNTDKGKEFLCEGSIISEKYILTSAYCVKDVPQRYTLSHVRVREHNLSSEVDCVAEFGEAEGNTYCGPPYQDIQISELIFHPNYNSDTYDNNIGLIRLNTPLQYSDTLAPICLPFELEDLAPKKIILNGWGTNNFAPQSQVLLRATYNNILIEECRRNYSRIAPQIKIGSNQVCLEEKDVRSSNYVRCVGENGDAAYFPHVRNDRINYIQYGIMSFSSKNCQNHNVPKILTKISPYINWILDSVKP